jgi:hypothetical protein
LTCFRFGISLLYSVVKVHKLRRLGEVTKSPWFNDHQLLLYVESSLISFTTILPCFTFVNTSLRGIFERPAFSYHVDIVL